MNNDLIEIRILSLKQLEEYKEFNFFLLFRKDHNIPGTGETWPFIPTTVGYMIEFEYEEYINPSTNRLAKATLLNYDQIVAILNKRSFKNNLENYGISLRAYVFKDLEILKNYSAQTYNQRMEEKKELEDLKKQEKQNINERILSQNKHVVDSVNEFSYALVQYLLNKIILKPKAKKNSFDQLFTISIVSIYQSLMWVFITNPRLLKANNMNFAKSTVLKTWYGQLNDFINDKLENHHKLNYEDKMWEFLQNPIYRSTYYSLIEIFNLEEISTKINQEYKKYRSKVGREQKYAIDYFGSEFDDFDCIFTDLKPPSKSAKNAKTKTFEEFYINETKIFAYNIKEIIEKIN